MKKENKKDISYLKMIKSYYKQFNKLENRQNGKSSRSVRNTNIGARKRMFKGAWVAHSVEHLTLDFSARS